MEASTTTIEPVLNWQASLTNALSVYLPNLLGGLAILLFGWIVALILAAVTRKALGALRVDERLNAQAGMGFSVQTLASRVVFWAVFLLALIGMFGVLNVDGVSGPLSMLANTVMLFLPNLLMALLLSTIAWLLATAVRSLINRALAATQLDEKLSESAGVQPLSVSMGNVAYWLVLLLFLPAIVSVLQIQGLMVPLSEMTTSLLGMLPNLLAATVIGLVGWIIAKVLRGLVGNLLSSAGVDRLSADSEATRGMRLSELGGTLAFVLVVVPTLVAALDALRIEALSGPLIGMLDVMLLALPNVLAAAAILLLAWFVGRLVSELVTRLLANLGFDRLPERIGIAMANSSAVDKSEAAFSLSRFGGQVALFFIMLFATVEAAALLGFAGVHDQLQIFIAFGANVLLGLAIFVIGYWLANLAAKAIERANPQGGGLSRIARVAILGLVIAMGLRAMGVADDIVSLAFGLTLGAVAVALALAFGLGGREAAARIAERWASNYLSRAEGKDGSG